MPDLPVAGHSVPIDENSSAGPDGTAVFILKLLRRNWFAMEFPPAEGRQLAVLLLELALRYGAGLLMTKTDVARALGVDHKMTALKYIKLAEQLGFIELKQSPFDKRLELIVISNLGRTVVYNDLLNIGLELRDEVHYRYGIAGAVVLNNGNIFELRVLDELLVQGTTVGRHFKLRADPKRAIRELSQTIAVAPGNLDARLSRARSYTSQRRFDEALKDIHSVLELDPTNAEARLHILLLDLTAGRLKPGLNAIRELGKSGRYSRIARHANRILAITTLDKSLEDLWPIIHRLERPLEVFGMRLNQHIKANQSLRVSKEFDLALTLSYDDDEREEIERLRDAFLDAGDDGP